MVTILKSVRYELPHPSYFDDAGNFVFHKEGNDVRDSWLDSIDTAKVGFFSNFKGEKLECLP